MTLTLSGTLTVPYRRRHKQKSNAVTGSASPFVRGAPAQTQPLSKPSRARADNPIIRTGAMVDDAPIWLAENRQFGFDDLVHWRGKVHGADLGDFEHIARRISIVVLGPHASAAFPHELHPFVSPSLTRRKQHDFSDVITGAVGRAWAACDARVVFVEAPHSRVAKDANREHKADLEPALREFFSRLRRQRAGEAGVSFAGVDGVRPISFSGEDVLLEPESDVAWARLIAALNAASRLGFEPYNAAVESVVAAVRAARVAASRVTLIGLHDTSSRKMRPDGAIVVERSAAEQLPALVNFGNLGDFRGEAKSGVKPLMDGAAMRRVAHAWCSAFGFEHVDAHFGEPAGYARDEVASFNRPYAGGVEVKRWARRLSAEGEEGGLPFACDVFQVEFERDALLGDTVAAALREPGGGWPAVDEQHVANVASCLRAATDQLNPQANDERPIFGRALLLLCGTTLALAVAFGLWGQRSVGRLALPYWAGK